MRILNACEHGHLTNEEVRKLPTGDGGNAILCRTHFQAELQYRKERIANGVPFDLPQWDNLEEP